MNWYIILKDPVYKYNKKRRDKTTNYFLTFTSSIFLRRSLLRTG